jgi:LysM repeat protein
MLVLLLVTTFGLKAQELVDSYIETFQYIAVSEMERTGIPASIKLAQGLLESNWGRSELSSFAHNHFGIKCGSSWEGKGYYKVDDDLDENGKLRESCFRVFESDEASYIAHSEFLLNNKRYSFLFDYGPTDHKSWAKGLKKAGYATDPKYPSKLIGVIQKYQLSRFDYMVAEELDLFAQVEDNHDELSQEELDFMSETISEIDRETTGTSIEEPRKSRKKKKKSFWAEATKDSDFTKNYVKYKKKWENNVKEAIAEVKEEKNNKRGFNFDNLLNEVVEIGNSVLGEDEKAGPTSFPDLESHNDVKMTLANGGETLQDIAIRSGVNVNDLYRFNDKIYKIKSPILDKSIVYLEAKKTSFSGSRETHEVRQGEKIVEIAQRYAITEKALRKRNYLGEKDELKHGEILYLKGLRIGRKPKVRKSRSDSITFTDI